MLPRAHRLRTDRDYQQIFRRGRRLQGTFVSLRVAPNALEHGRLGFVVGKTVSKKAVVRNTIKRRLRAITRELHLDQPQYDIAFIAQRPAATATTSDLRQEVQRLLSSTHRDQTRR